MNCHRRCSGFLDDLRDLHRIDMLVIKSFPDLDSHRFLDRFHDRAHKLVDKPRIFHQCGSLFVLHDFRHRTSHINIQKCKRPLFDPFCHLADDLRIGAEQLQ